MENEPSIDYNTINFSRIETDWEIISLVLSQEDIDNLVAEAAALTVIAGESHLFMETTVIDLESICTLDYRRLPELTPDKVKLMEQWLSGQTESVVDMLFLELKSTLTLGWYKPQSNDDIRAISYHNSVFNLLLYRHAQLLSSKFSSNRYNMPYWLRLSQLRIMSHIPNKLIHDAKLYEIFFFPIHQRGLNATSVSINGEKFITANFGLSGILNELNRFIYHFQETEDFSLGNREIRALPEIIPIVLYFLNSGSSVHFLPQFVFGTSTWKIKTLSDYQLDFIILHEISHHILLHPERAKLIKDHVERKHKIKQFEYEADTLANALMASGVVKRGQYTAIVYTDAVEAVELLFEHMNFIEKMEEIIRNRFGSYMNISSTTGSHPDAYTRLEYFHRIFKNKKRPLSEIALYAKNLYKKMTDHCLELSNEDIANLIKKYII